MQQYQAEGYKTARIPGEGEYQFVSLKKWFKDGESFMFLVQRIDGSTDLFHRSELDRFTY